eukprot:11531608-Ditylum_brightwellii.AAC.1
MFRAKVTWITRKGCNPDDVRKGTVGEMVGYQETGCHLIFNVKMDVSRKVCFVAGRHTTEAPAAMIFSSAVSRGSIRLTFLIAGLNNLDFISCNLQNAYLNAKHREKIWFGGGKE